MLEISKHSIVTLTYDLHLDDAQGELIEQATAENPLEFLFGAGAMLPKFESQLASLKKGEPFTIRLAKDDAYGEVNEEAIVELPKNVFFIDGVLDEKMVAVGNSVPMMSSNGQRLNGTVLEVNEETVKMDFNHPLAGEDLFFAGTIVEVRQPSDEELAGMLAGGCGCGDGGCGDGGCSDDGCGSGHDDSHGCGCGC